MTTNPAKPTTLPAATRTLEVELLAIDLSTCTRCTGTLANLEAAIEAVRQVAAPTGTAIRLRKILVGSEAEARQHRFVTSPTVRVAGRDIAFDTLESRCDTCTDLCGCQEGTSCRIWRYQGQEFTEAPVGLVVEALLREIAGAPAAAAPTDAAGFEVPENLRRFFAGKAEREPAAATCCPPAELASCCAPEEKASCCAPAATTCGCA